MLENLKGIHLGGGKPLLHKSSLNNRWVRLAIGCGLLCAGYLLFQIAGGFPPQVWRFLFNVLPRLQSLWAIHGSGVLFPLIGLFFFSLSLLILWSVIVFGIIWSLVPLWPASKLQECIQIDLDEGALVQPSSQLRLPGTFVIHDARLQLLASQVEHHLPEALLAEDSRGLGTRDVSEQRTVSLHVARTQEEDGQDLSLVIGIGLDPGLVRKDRPNEDSLFAIQGKRITKDGPVLAGLFVVADGMGGHANGGDASRLAVREISDCIVPVLLGDFRDERGDEQDFWLNLLKDGVQRANLAIHQQNQTQPQMMGTTVTAALVVDTTAYVLNVGDSRTYLYRAADGLVQITRDHSTVARLVDAGEIKQDEIYTHPQRNQIYRCLGEYPMVEMDTFVVPLQSDDILLLCSDGLWEMVRDPIMEKILMFSSHLPAQISNVLVQAALNQGGSDNICIVVVLLKQLERRDAKHE